MNRALQRAAAPPPAVVSQQTIRTGTEEWRPVVRRPKIAAGYQVSSLGRVRGLSGRPHHVYLTGKGYYETHLILEEALQPPRPRKRARIQGVFVHQLVADAFVPKAGRTAGAVYVNHKNGNRGDNRVCNLEWVTQRENRQRRVYEPRTHQCRRVVKCDAGGRVLRIYADGEAEQGGGVTGAGAIEGVRAEVVGRSCREPLYRAECVRAHGCYWRYYDEVFEAAGASANERWVAIEGAGGALISDQGRVRNAKRGGVTLGTFNGDYMMWRGQCVHRLVARAFLPAPGGAAPVVNHKNGNKCDNRACNLEWATLSENRLHGLRAGKQHYRSGPRRRPVWVTTLATGAVQRYTGVRAASAALGVNDSGAVSEAARTAKPLLRGRYAVRYEPEAAEWTREPVLRPETHNIAAAPTV